MSIAKKVWAYIKLLRPEISDMDLALPAASALLAAYVVGGGFPDPIRFAVAVIGGYFAITSSYVFNDWCDVDIDRINLPNRPLPSGLVSKSGAFIYSLLLFLTAAIIAFYLNPESFIVLVMATLVITFYSAVAKRRTPFSFIPVGIAYGLVPIGIWLVFDPAGILTDVNNPSQIGIIPISGLLLGIMICVTDWGFTLSGVSRDIEGDRLRNVPTTPVKFGIKFTSKLIFVFWIIGVLCSLLIGYFAHLGPIYFGGALMAGIWMLYQCIDFINNPTPERGGTLFLQGSRYRSVMFSSLIVDVVFCALWTQYPFW
ncbi:ubiquinone biosynthesis protein UbiA [Methanosarcinales archaeon]|nr:MAG: ubiquinone biosynthesis protein UbiA [Methanosarcinales archaeon]